MAQEQLKMVLEKKDTKANSKDSLVNGEQQLNKCCEKSVTIQILTIMK